MTTEGTTNRTSNEPLYRIRLARPVGGMAPTSGDVDPPPFSRMQDAGTNEEIRQPRKNVLRRIYDSVDKAVTERFTLPFGRPPAVQNDASLRTVPGMKAYLVEWASPAIANYAYPEAPIVRDEIHYPNLQRHFHELLAHYKALINPHGHAHVSDRVLDFLCEMEDGFVRTQIDRRYGHGRDAGYHSVGPNKTTSQYTMASGLVQTWKELNRTARHELATLRNARTRAQDEDIEPAHEQYLASLERYGKAQERLSRAILIRQAVQSTALAKASYWRARTTPGGTQSVGAVGAGTTDSKSLWISGGAKKGLTSALDVGGTGRVAIMSTHDVTVDRDASVNNQPSLTINNNLSATITTPVVGATASAELNVTPFSRYYESIDPTTAEASRLTDDMTRTHNAVSRKIRAITGKMSNEMSYAGHILGATDPSTMAERELKGLDQRSLDKRFRATQAIHDEAAAMDAALRQAHGGLPGMQADQLPSLADHVDAAFPLYSQQLQSMGVPHAADQVADSGNKLPTVKSVPSTASGRDPSAPAHNGATKLRLASNVSGQFGINPAAYRKLRSGDGPSSFNKPSYVPFAKLTHGWGLFHNTTYLTRQQNASDNHPNLYPEQMPDAVTKVVSALHAAARSDSQPSEAHPFGRHPALTLANERFPRGTDGQALISLTMPLMEETVPAAARDLDLYGSRTQLAEAYRRWLQALDIHQSGATGLSNFALDPADALPALLKSYRDYASDSQDIWFHIARARETSGAEHAEHLRWLNHKVFDGAYRVNARSSEETKRFFYLYATSMHDFGYSSLRGLLDSTLAALVQQRPAMSAEAFDALMQIATQIQAQREAQFAFVDHADNGNPASQQERIHLIAPDSKSTNFGADSTMSVEINLALIEAIRKKLPMMPNLGPLGAGSYTLSQGTLRTRQTAHPNQNRTGESMEFTIALTGGPEILTAPLATVVGHVTDASMRNKTFRQLPSDTRASLTKEVSDNVVALVRQEGAGAVGGTAGLRLIVRFERPSPIGDEQPPFKLAHMALNQTRVTPTNFTTANVLPGTPGNLSFGGGTERRTTQVDALSRGSSLRANLVYYSSLSGHLVKRPSEASTPGGGEEMDFEETRRRLLAASSANASGAWFGALGDPIVAALCDLAETSRREPEAGTDPDPLGPLDGEYILRGHMPKANAADTPLALNYRHTLYKSLNKPSTATASPLSAYARLRGLFEKACPEHLNRPDGDDAQGWRDLSSDFARIEALTRDMGMVERIDFYTRHPDGQRLLALFREAMGVMAEVSTSVRLGAESTYGTRPHTRAVDLLCKNLAPQRPPDPPAERSTPTADETDDDDPARTAEAIAQALHVTTSRRLDFIYRHVPDGPDLLKYKAGLGPLVEEAAEDPTEDATEGMAAAGTGNETRPVDDGTATTFAALPDSVAHRAGAAWPLDATTPSTPAGLRTPSAMRHAIRPLTDPDSYGALGREATHPPIATVPRDHAPPQSPQPPAQERSSSVVELDLTTLASSANAGPWPEQTAEAAAGTAPPPVDVPNPMLAESVSL